MQLLMQNDKSASVWCQIVILAEKKGERIVWTVKPKRSSKRNGQEEDLQKQPVLDLSDMDFDSHIRMSRVGVSLVSEKLKEELLFGELNQVVFTSVSKGDTQSMSLRISDVQFDSQLERSEKPVLLANRGGIGGKSAKLSPGDITGESDQPTATCFLELKIDRPTAVSRDLVFKNVSLSLDDLEVDMDIEVFGGISDFYNECLKSLGFSLSSRGVPRAEIELKYQYESILEGYVPPRLPQVVVLESLKISEFTLHAWCSFLLDRVQFLGDTMIVLLRVVMASGRLELRGAPIKFIPEAIANTALRGSMKTILSVISERYSAQIFNSLATLVGYSSLLNIPRVPVELLRSTFGVGLTAADNVSTGISSFMTNLTFDKDYINRRQRERQLARRSSHNLSSGLQAAVKNLGEGFMSLSNVVTKPIEGGRKDGFQGAVKGFGQGLMGSLIKPVDKMGQALSNVASGVRAEYMTKPLGARKLVCKRRRKPRMLWGEHGRLRDYEQGEADIREMLGLKFAKSVLQCITLEKPNMSKHMVLVFYPKRLLLIDLAAKMIINASSSGSTILTDCSGGGSGFLSGGRGKRIWKVNVAEIERISASTEGVNLQMIGGNEYQIPCKDASIIQKVISDIHMAQQALRSEVIVTKNGLVPDTAAPVSVDL